MKQIKEWLKSINCDGELEAITGDASFRKYYRLKSSMHSGIVMDSSLQKESIAPFVDIEHRLYEAGVRVAKIFTYDMEKGFVFLEDLGNTHLYDIINDDFELFYNKAIDTIVKMQNTDTEGLPLYDKEFLHFEMDLMKEWYIEKYLGITLNETQESMLKETLESISSVVLSQPHDVFVHRDFHSKNLMFGCSEDIVVIDYQDARVGPLTYDLVSLLRDVYVEFDIKDVERLALRFKEIKGINIDDETFMRWFDFMGLQRHIKILGIFARLNIRDGKKDYLEHIPLTLKYVLEIASKYEETQSLAKMIKEIS
ncbi:COG3178: Predicted phosphotransferase related to Ser/Thr protein kinases [hydrothermal vent metagenome]|uniref:COG3178: Predicted phosphotransferase related to Ser/Thr protein kinases n=1 Tax=hydrothermal vent metagenome TaxID=652676 RepID=A0A1W1EEY2_9ZZZZ